MSACETLRDELAEVALGAPPSETLRSHLETCDACDAELERLRALAQHIDEAVCALVRATPPEKLLDDVLARARSSQAGMPRLLRTGVAVGAAAIAASIAIVFGVRGIQPHNPQVANVAGLTSWHSPTAMLLKPHDSVLFAPLRDPRFDIDTTPSHTKRSLGENS